MSKKLLFSLLTATIIFPFFSNSASAYPGYGKQHGGSDANCGQMCGNSPCSGYDSDSNPMHKKIRDPKFMEMVQPVRDANRALFSALETGDIKNIQSSAKKLADAMKNVTDAELKKSLENASRIASLMSTATTYKEMRAGYNILKKETRMYHPNKKQYRERFPRLIVDTKTYNSIEAAEEQMHILVKALNVDSDTALNTKIDTLMNTVKSIKMPQLQDYVNPILATLTDMKKAKTILDKATYRQMLFGRVSQLSMITKEKD